MSKIRSIITSGISIVLFATLLFNNIILAQDGSSYDPWMDLNDDGIIDPQDLQLLASIYSKSGTPINKTERLLELEARMDSLNATVILLENELSVVQTNVSDLQTSIDSLDTRLSDLETRVSAFETSYADLESRVSDLEATPSNWVQSVSVSIPSAGHPSPYTSWADLGPSLDITTGNGKLLVMFTGFVHVMDTGDNIARSYFRILLDGQPVGVDTQNSRVAIQDYTGNRPYMKSPINIIRLTDVEAGTHTIQVQWTVGEASSYFGATGDPGQLIAIEVLT